MERTVEPGSSSVIEVVVKNQTERAFAFSLEMRDLAPSERRDGSFDLVAVGDGTRGAATWMAPAPAEFRLGPVREQRVRIALEVPADAPPGGRYAALRVLGTPTSASGNVVVSPEVPVTILLRVAGEVERDLRVSVDSGDRWRWRGGRSTWRVRLENRGGTHENVSGRLRVDGVFSKPRTSPLRPGILLPGEVRDQELDLELRGSPDVLGGTVRVDRQDGGDRVVADADRIVVLPWWVLVMLTACVALLVVRVRRR